MSGPDRRHAVGVARKVAQQMGNSDGGGVSTAVLAAALLHDLGKVESGFGTTSRVLATVAAIAAGRDRVARWASRASPADGALSRWKRRAGLYVTHDRIGADLLAQAGSDYLVVTWAREHHLPAERWTVERGVANVLKDADDD
jgi:hypothetical protein